MSLGRSAYVIAALVGLTAAGFGLVGVAAAAPADPSPTSTAPTTADAAPAPIPLVYKPVDTSDGLFGMPRGTVPTASTGSLSQVPIANQLPYVGVTPLPVNSAAYESSDAVDTDTADAAPDDAGSDPAE